MYILICDCEATEFRYIKEDDIEILVCANCGKIFNKENCWDNIKEIQ